MSPPWDRHAITRIGFRLGPVIEQVSFPLHSPGLGCGARTITKRMRGSLWRDGWIDFLPCTEWMVSETVTSHLKHLVFCPMQSNFKSQVIALRSQKVVFVGQL